VTESDQTIALLRDLRDQMVATRVELKGELAATRAELAATRTELKAEIATLRTNVNERIDLTNDRLAIVETTVRGCAQQLLMLGRHVKNHNERTESAIDDLRERVTKLENTRTP
jgi:chromosome segregation ATPase